MKINSPLKKSLILLTQPWTWLALGLLLVNDHILRRLWPFWWTGKLGDFAWLFIAPILLALILGITLPHTWKNRTLWVGLSAYGLTALFFTALKTFSPFRDSILTLWENLLGFPAQVLTDPTDLIALVALLASGILWFRASPAPEPLPLRAWLTLPLFALLTLADAAAPDNGINCLRLQEGRVLASAGYVSYTSPDGGLTWQPDTNSAQGCRWDSAHNQTQAEDAANNLSYRIMNDGGIEKSKDGGSSWQPLEGFHKMTDQDEIYYRKTHGGSPVISPVPRDTLFEPTSGNVIFALGHAGILVVKPDGSLTQVKIGIYGPVDYSQPSVFSTLLERELSLTLCLGLLLIPTWFTLRRGWINRVLVLVSFLVWFLVLLVISEHGYMGDMAMVALQFLILFCFGLAVESIIFSIRKKAGSWWKPLLYALGGSLFFFLPYVLWFFHILPNYSLAGWSSVIIVLVWAACGMLASWRGKPSPSPLH